MLWSTLLIALREIRRNKMRSLLTMLGIVIGVGAVIAMVMLGDGATASVTASISSLGENLLILTPGAGRHGPGGVHTAATPLSVQDAAAIEHHVGGLERVAPMASRQSLVVFGGKNWRTSVVGTTPPYFRITSHTLGRGRWLDAADGAAGRAVCMLGETTRRELFGSGDPLGESIRIGKLSCTVVGVLALKGTSGAQDPDDIVVMPLTTLQRRIAGNRDVAMVYMSARSGRAAALIKHQIRLLMRERRHLGRGDEDDFSIRDMQEIISAVSSVTGVLTALLGGIAAVSLLVGGIGIMNIMLVSVTERTREIGIRLAIGARGREVLLQFLIEAMALSLLGGMVGVLFGLVLGYAATNALSMPLVVSPQVIVLAFVFSAFVGILFGFLPARKAARLNPIEALRHE